MVKNKLAKVVKVIDQHRCVINKGSDDGVSLDDRFIVYNLGEVIFDPESGDELGTLEIVRGRAEVIHVQPRLATLETYEREILSERRIIHRPSRVSFGNEIEEVNQSERAQFNGLKAGDFARPI